MKRLNIKYTLILALLMPGLSSCYRVTVEVRSLPSNTPEGAEIFITGEFNNWDPGDERYRLKTLGDTLYYIDLPMGFGELEYKFTRGDWTTVEKDDCGYESDNRVLVYGKEEEVVVNSIASWADLDPVDCDRVTIVITSLPDNTPRDALLQLIGNITNWDAGNDDYTFHIDDTLGLPVLTIFRPELYDAIEFKITRGSLSRSEGDGLGRDTPPRRVQFGEVDTLFVEVSSWQDLEQAKGDMITLIVDRIPENTPKDDPIFFVGEINDWYPYDQNLRLEKNRKGQYFINLPLRAYGTEYKFTRGNWNTVEKDDYGYEIDNRVLLKEKSSDTVFVSIWNWADLSIPLGGEVTIWVIKYPKNTPADAELYLAGNFNNWDPGNSDWKFNRTTEGFYFIAIPRQGNMLEFKITRGSWNSVEVDKNGNDIDNRIYRWGSVEWLEVEVVKWKDL
ncbi:MAG: hypothetical protein V2I47_05930 [Bacteroidales bacterium]|jgi:hypothetical protein|nr:hypothetical protein [Bacteroidales bacterium]